MNLAFVGADGASGVLILIGLAILVLLSAILFVSGLALAFKKRTKLCIAAFLLSLVFAIYPFRIYVSYTGWAEFQKNRKRNFELSPGFLPPANIRSP
jgi:hypothetical protein